jgi:hypothetical protein
VFGGILGFYAVLRREIFWGNFKLEFFGVLLVGPRRAERRGDACWVFGGILGVKLGWVEILVRVLRCVVGII